MARSFKQSETFDPQAQENFLNRRTLRRMKRAQRKELTENEGDGGKPISYGYSPRTYR